MYQTRISHHTHPTLHWSVTFSGSLADLQDAVPNELIIPQYRLLIIDYRQYLLEPRNQLIGEYCSMTEHLSILTIAHGINIGLRNCTLLALRCNLVQKVGKNTPLEMTVFINVLSSVAN